MLKYIIIVYVFILFSCETSVECKCVSDTDSSDDEVIDTTNSQIALGTILDTEKLYAIDSGTSDLNDMFVSNMSTNGSSFRDITSMISESSTVTLTINDGQGNANSVRSYIFTYNITDPSGNNGSFNSLNDLISELNTANFDNGTGTGTNLAFSVGIHPTAGTNGFLQLANITDEMTVTFESSNPALNLALATLNRTGVESGGAPSVQAPTYTDYRFHHIARDTDLLSHLVDKNGRSLGLIEDDIITVYGRVGGETIDNGGVPSELPQIVVMPTGAVATPFGGGTATNYFEFVTIVKNFFSITNEQGVVIDNDGSMKLYGDSGLVNELSNLHITADTAIPSSPLRLSIFNSVFDGSGGNYDVIQEARDAKGKR